MFLIQKIGFPLTPIDERKFMWKFVSVSSETFQIMRVFFLYLWAKEKTEINSKNYLYYAA